MSYRIQIVEDESIVALDLKDAITRLGYQVVDVSSSGEAALVAARQLAPDLVLMDIHLDGRMDGTQTARILREEMNIPVVFLTAYAEEHTLQAAAACTPFGYLLKPFELRELNATLRMALACSAAEARTRAERLRLALAMESANLVVWEWHGNGDNARCIQPGTDSTQLALRDETPSRTLLDILEPADRKQLLSALETTGQAGMTARVQEQDGTPIWVELNARRVGDAGTPDDKVIGILRDITERHEMEARLRQASVMFNSTAEGIVLLDAAHRIKVANPAFLKMTGHTADDLIDTDIDDLLHERKHSAQLYEELAQNPQKLWHGELLCRRKTGELFPAWEHLSAVTAGPDKPVEYILACSDISAIRNAERELNHMAYHDALTGLGNRRLLEEQLAIELERARHGNQPLGLLFIDLDGFKSVNDSLGHAAGDKMLQIMAERLRHTLRRSDLATRLGGDEFFILCPHSEAEACTTLAERLLDLMSQPVCLGDEMVSISGSIGIALFPEHGDTVDALISAADTAMYEAKARGKRQFHFFNAAIAQKTRQHLRIEQRLRQAVRDEAFELHYQPLVSLPDNRLTGFEALIRWRDGDTLRMPDTFIPVAEECELIHDIGEWVLRQACRKACEWQDQLAIPLKMSVNVSARQLAMPDFVQKVGHILFETGLLPHLLELEVTESTLQVIEDSQRVLADLKALGISLAIDDFGTGYSSMALLQHLTIDRLKIDRAFVRDVPNKLRDRAICKALVTLAHSLSLAITAEGIEHQGQASFLCDIGCDTGQGYLFARPLDAAQLDAYLAGRERKTAPGAHQPAGS